MMNGSVGKGKLVDVVYFNFTKDFDVVSHSTFIAGLNNRVVRMLEYWLGHQA